MKYLVLKEVKFKMMVGISDRIREEKLNPHVFIDYNGNSILGDISIRFGINCDADRIYKVLQIVNEEYSKVYLN